MANAYDYAKRVVPNYRRGMISYAVGEQLFDRKDKGENWDQLNEQIETLMKISKSYNNVKVIECLMKCVPEYTPDNRSLNQKLSSKIYVEKN